MAIEIACTGLSVFVVAVVVFGGGAGESGTNGIEHDVVDDIAPFGIVLDVVLVAALLPEIAASAEGLIGVVGGACFEFFYGVVEVSFGDFGLGRVVIFVVEIVKYVDEEVDVIGHDAVSLEVVVFAVHVVELVFYSATDIGVLEEAGTTWMVVELMVVLSEEAFDGFFDWRFGLVGMVLQDLGFFLFKFGFELTDNLMW